jgi:hypothetical protein
VAKALAQESLWQLPEQQRCLEEAPAVAGPGWSSMQFEAHMGRGEVTPNLLRPTTTGVSLEGSLAGTWDGAGRAADIIIEQAILNSEFGLEFESQGEAHTHAIVRVADTGADGAVIVNRSGVFYAYTVNVKAMILDFTREHVGDGEDFLIMGDVPGVACFVTKDGYAVQPTRDAAGNDTYRQVSNQRIPVHGSAAQRLPGSGDYEGLSAAVRDNGDREIGDDGRVALFKAMIVSTAMDRLDFNWYRLNDIRQQYGSFFERQDEWDSLQEAAERDRRLLEVRAEVAGNPEKLTEIDEARRVLHSIFPGLATIDPSQGWQESAHLHSEMITNIDEAQGHIEAVQDKIWAESIDLEELSPVIVEVMDRLDISETGRRVGDPMSEAALGWLEREEIKETVLTWGAIGAGVICTIVAIAATGGVAAIAGVIGAGIGITDAARNFDKVRDKRDLARSGGAGGLSLNDGDVGQLEYTLAIVDLVLSSIDVVGITDGLSTANKVRRGLSEGAQGVSRAADGQIVGKAGWFDAIDANATRKGGFDFEDRIWADGTITTTVRDASGNKGTWVRGFDPDTGELQLIEAFRRGLDPRILADMPLDAAGSPLNLYVTARQMKKLGVKAGSVGRVVMKNVVNKQTSMQLAALRKHRFPGVAWADIPEDAMADMVRETQSYKYARNTLGLTGHDTGAFDVIEFVPHKNGVGMPVEALVARNHLSMDDVTLYGLELDEIIPWEFDIIISRRGRP